MDGNTALSFRTAHSIREPTSKTTWKPMNIEVLNITLTFPDGCHLWHTTPLQIYGLILSLIISCLPSHLSRRHPFHCIKRFNLLWIQLFHIFSQFLFHKTGGMWFFTQQHHSFLSWGETPLHLHLGPSSEVTWQLSSESFLLKQQFYQLCPHSWQKK